jgi:hypothetical protein
MFGVVDKPGKNKLTTSTGFDPALNGPPTGTVVTSASMKVKGDKFMLVIVPLNENVVPKVPA